MARYLVIGGFERSGHDATTEAVVEAARARAHNVDTLIWRDRVPRLEEHPMFVSHRHAAAHGASDIAGLLDEPWIGAALASDLATYIPGGYDAYICVHPWSSLIAAAVLAHDWTGTLVDYHSDFGTFPVIEHPRITAYLGGGRPRALAPAIRSRCHSIGVAVPRRFHMGLSEALPIDRPSRLVVSAGSDGWAVRAMRDAARALAAHLDPQEVVLLAPSEEAREAWSNAGISYARIDTGQSDIAPLLRDARWYLSKGGGTAVSEGMAAGCECYVTRSGIFWEDEAAEILHARGMVALVDASGVRGSYDHHQVQRVRQQCRGASDLLWALVEGGLPRRYDDNEAGVLDELLKRLAAFGTGLLPETTDQLAKSLAAWRKGWGA